MFESYWIEFLLKPKLILIVLLYSFAEFHVKEDIIFIIITVVSAFSHLVSYFNITFLTDHTKSIGANPAKGFSSKSIKKVWSSLVFTRTLDLFYVLLLLIFISFGEQDLGELQIFLFFTLWVVLIILHLTL